MPRREEPKNVQRWKETFVQLMKRHKPEDIWKLDVSDDLGVSSYGWYMYDEKQVFASFECSSCSKEWKSIQVVVRFHMRLERSGWSSSQGQVKMKMFRQKCRRCLKAEYEEPIFNDEAIQKVLHNLALKILEKCYREPQKHSQFVKHEAEEEVDGPHDIYNCEACEKGICLGRTPLRLESRQSRQQENFPYILGCLLLFLAIFFFFFVFASHMH